MKKPLPKVLRTNITETDIVSARKNFRTCEPNDEEVLALIQSERFFEIIRHYGLASDWTGIRAINPLASARSDPWAKLALKLLEEMVPGLWAAPKRGRPSGRRNKATFDRAVATALAIRYVEAEPTFNEAAELRKLATAARWGARWGFPSPIENPFATPSAEKADRSPDIKTMRTNLKRGRKILEKFGKI